MKSYFCLRCNVDFEEEDKLVKNRPAKCPKCKEGKFVIRANNPLKKIGDKSEKAKL